MTKPTVRRLPVLFISHGGGPWPYVDTLKQNYVRTEKELRRLPERLPARPKAVLVISGHWEAPQFSVSTNARPPMEYDYSGFPPHTTRSAIKRRATPSWPGAHANCSPRPASKPYQTEAEASTTASLFRWDSCIRTRTCPL